MKGRDVELNLKEHIDYLLLFFFLNLPGQSRGRKSVIHKTSDYRTYKMASYNANRPRPDPRGFAVS